jgi:soluble lytic murein transglycosylase-like protein
VPPLLETDGANSRGMSGLIAIPLFAERLAHSSVPLKPQAAVARSGGQERPKAGACALLLTVASTAAPSRSEGTARILASVFRAATAALVIGIAMIEASTSAAQAEQARSTASVASQRTDPYADHIADAAQRFSVPATWIRAVMRVESAKDPHALSPKGAIGLMQIMPKTWQKLRARYGLGADPYDPRDNILAGAAYLRELCDRFGSPGFLAAYNAGPERYAQHLATLAPLPAETEKYVAVLAPIIEGSQPERVGDDASNTPLWRSASLFAAPIERRLSDPRSASSLLPSPSTRDTTIVDLSALAPPSNGLFVRRLNTERVR